jgi:hypothetical protein
MTNLIQSPFSGKDQETFLTVCANLDGLIELHAQGEGHQKILNTISLFGIQYSKSLEAEDLSTIGNCYFLILEKLFNAFEDLNQTQKNILSLLENESYGDTVRERCLFIRNVIFDLFNRIFSQSVDYKEHPDYTGVTRLQSSLWYLTHIFDVTNYPSLKEGRVYGSFN